MRRVIDYNFALIDAVMYELIYEKPSAKITKNLQRELNKFFTDCRCLEVIYTENDGMFFGMRVIPVIDAETANRIIQTDEPIRLDTYYLELDSKLFEPILDFTPAELTAIVLHEVGHMVNDTQPIEELRRCIDIYLARNNEVIKIGNSIHYSEILAYGMKDALVKITSIFETDEEVLADEFVVACGYGDHLARALDKIVKNGFRVNAGQANKMVTLSWVLRLYKDVKLRRIPAIRTLQKAKSMTSSNFQKREYDGVIKRLNRIDDEALIESVIKEGKVSNKFRELKWNNIKGILDDTYEISMRMRNTDNQDEALQLLRQINSNLSIIEDYLGSEPDISEDKKGKLYKAQSDLIKLRDDLANKVTYKEKYFGIYVNYPDIKMRY